MGTRVKKSSFNLRGVLLPAMITFASLSGIGLLLLAIIWGKRFFAENLSSDSLSSTFSGSLLGGDTRSRLTEELESLRTQVEAIGRSIQIGDQSAASAQRLLAEVPKFNDLFRRACKLPIESVSIEQFVATREKMRELLENLRKQSQSADGSLVGTPLPENYFWSINTAAKPEELVVHAINKVTELSGAVTSVMSQTLIEYPDPLTYSGPEFAWTTEDRRVLALIRLQGGTQRDALRILAGIDPKAPTQSEMKAIHTLMDRSVATAQVLQKLPGKSLGGMLVLVPKGNPYESQQVSASVSLNALRKLMEAETTFSMAGNFLFDEVEEFSKVCDSIMVGSQTGSLGSYLKSSPTSSGRFEAFIAAEEKKQADARQAELDRAAEEQRQLAAVELRKQLAEEEQRRYREERERALEQRKAEARAGHQGGLPGLGTPGRVQETIDALAGSQDSTATPTRPSGPLGATEPSMPHELAPDSNNPHGKQQPSAPRNFPGIGSRPSGPPVGFQPSPGVLGDPTKLVTISCAKVKNGDSSAYIRDLPKWFLQYGPVVSITNGSLKITIQNFDKPLSEIAQCFPMLVFEKIDNETRTITAREK